MRWFGKEEKVGLLVIFAIISVIYLTIKAGDLSLGRKRGATFYADFWQVYGLEKGSQVRVAGVEAGKIEDILLVNERPRIKMIIFPGIRIRKNTVARIQSQGFMGEKYLELDPGPPSDLFLEDGGFIKAKEEYADFDQLSNQVSLLVADLKAVTEAIKESVASPEGKAALQETLINLKTSTAQLSDLLKENTQQIHSIVSNVQSFSANLNNLLTRNENNISNTIKDLQKLVEILREKAPALADQFQSTTENLDELVVENRETLHKGLENTNHLMLKLQGTADELNGLLASVNHGEGTIGKLVKDDALYTEFRDTLGGLKDTLTKAEAFRLYLGFKTEYQTEFDKSKSYFSLKLQPSQDKYYLVELIDDFRGLTKTEETSILVDGNGPVTTRKEITEDEFKFSLQIAKRFQNLVLRGGLIESTGGVGLDYLLFKDDLQFFLEASDFAAEDPHVKLGADFQAGKYFSFTTGVDHLADNDNISYFLGAGFTFEDDDLKYLISKIPLPQL